MSDEKLKECPFCGGEAERVELEEPGNEGGSCIVCKKCGACSAVHFDRKENLEDAWNTRVHPLPAPDVDAIKALKSLLNEQAEDDALWFIADSITEAYFQQELRRLHAAAEDCIAALQQAGYVIKENGKCQDQ